MKTRDLFDKTDVEYHKNVLKYCFSDAFKALMNHDFHDFKNQIKMAIATIGMIHCDKL